MTAVMTIAAPVFGWLAPEWVLWVHGVAAATCPLVLCCMACSGKHVESVMVFNWVIWFANAKLQAHLISLAALLVFWLVGISATSLQFPVWWCFFTPLVFCLKTCHVDMIPRIQLVNYLRKLYRLPPL